MKRAVQAVADVKSIKGKEMEIRKLKQEEHIKTRKLWEAIFTEDTSEFLDYYYSVKTKENEIYVIEDEGKIVSMIHLNPYQVRMGEKICQAHYIVAVATDASYRRQGLMARLLNHVMQIMADRGEPFTFLMPAAEAIYKPFGFRYIYEQERGSFTGIKAEDDNFEFLYAKEEDCFEMAAFANEQLSKYDIVTWRTEGYYKMILKEQISDRGGILLVKHHGKLAGVFCFTVDENVEFREPLFCDEMIFRHAIYFLVGSDTKEVQCTGYGEERKSMIMAKILQPNLVNDFEKIKVFLNEVV